MRRHHLDVLHGVLPISPVVLNAHIRELDVVVDHRQLVSDVPLGGLVGSQTRAAVTVVTTTTRGLKETLIVPLEFLFQDHAANARSLPDQAIRRFRVTDTVAGGVPPIARKQANGQHRPCVSANGIVDSLAHEEGERRSPFSE
jgi:hypothetical protein